MPNTFAKKIISFTFVGDIQTSKKTLLTTNIMAETKEKLFSEFAPISTEEWMAKITADLKGVPFEKKLVWKTGEGFNANPFYRLEDL